jgi:carbamoyl-phosphate synthase large subunit
VELLKEAKLMGFSDQQISLIMQDGNDEEVYKKERVGIHQSLQDGRYL